MLLNGISHLSLFFTLKLLYHLRLIKSYQPQMSGSQNHWTSSWKCCVIPRNNRDMTTKCAKEHWRPTKQCHLGGAFFKRGLAVLQKTSEQRNFESGDEPLTSHFGLDSSIEVFWEAVIIWHGDSVWMLSACSFCVTLVLTLHKSEILCKTVTEFISHAVLTCWSLVWEKSSDVDFIRTKTASWPEY